MKKRKKIWIPIVSVLLVAAVGGGLALYFTQRPKAAVGVYDINQLSVMNYWGDEKTSSGSVSDGVPLCDSGGDRDPCAGRAEGDQGYDAPDL